MATTHILRRCCLELHNQALTLPDGLTLQIHWFQRKRRHLPLHGVHSEHVIVTLRVELFEYLMTQIAGGAPVPGLDLDISNSAVMSFPSWTSTRQQRRTNWQHKEPPTR